jgi:hypothetical protein
MPPARRKSCRAPRRRLATPRADGHNAGMGGSADIP